MKENKSNESRAGAEEMVDRYLRSLSDLEAPESLILRVQSVIETRAKRPWWQQSYQDWDSLTRRWVLLVVCCLVAGLAWFGNVLIPELGRDTLANLPLVGTLEPLWQVATILLGMVQDYLGQVSAVIYYGLGGLLWLGYLLTVATASFLCRLVQLQSTR